MKREEKQVHVVPTPEGEVKDMKTYAFKFILEKDKWDDEPDELAVWHVYCPLLVDRGASTWGYTSELFQDLLETFAYRRVRKQLAVTEYVIPYHSTPLLACV